MICKECRKEAFVFESRPDINDNIRYRGYKCKECGHKFYTIEVMTDESIAVSKINKIIDRRKKERVFING